MGRKPCCDKDGVNRGTWSVMEDQILINFIEVHGEGKWRDVPKRAGLNRCGKSCRLRWLNYLRPDIKRGNISQDEEDLIIRLHKLLGNRWSLIAGRLPGRTDNEIKNFWNTNLSKRVLQMTCTLNNPSDPITTKTPIVSTRPSSYAHRVKISSSSTHNPVDSSHSHPVIQAKAARCTKKVILPQSTAAGWGTQSTTASASNITQDHKNLNELLCSYGFLEDFDVDDLLTPDQVPAGGPGTICLKKKKKMENIDEDDEMNKQYYCDCEKVPENNVGVEGGSMGEANHSTHDWMVGGFFQSEYEDMDFSFLNLPTDSWN